MEKNLNFKDLNINYSLINLLYLQYKNFIFPALVIVVSLIIIFIILVPQTQGLLKNQELLKQEQEKLTTLKNNYTLLSGIDEAEINSDLKTLVSALPSSKDFAGILNTISYNSVRTGVSISDFTFQVGDLKKTDDVDNPESPYLKLSLNLSGSPSALIAFISELYESSPLVETMVIKSEKDQGSIILLFPFKAFPDLKVDNFVALNQFSPQEREILERVKAWSDTSLVFSLPIDGLSSESSPSGEFSDPFGSGQTSTPSPL